MIYEIIQEKKTEQQAANESVNLEKLQFAGFGLENCHRSSSREAINL